jgi:hypothetical protein
VPKRTRLIDPLGFRWNVHEVTPESGDREGIREGAPAPGEGSLYFFSRYWTRKLSVYPPNWLELTPEELERLRQQAVPLSRPDPKRAELTDRAAAVSRWDERPRPKAQWESTGTSSDQWDGGSTEVPPQP